MDTTLVLLGIGLALSFFMAWNLGANDAATPTDCAVGSGALSVKRAVLLFAVFSLAGAMTQGFMTIKTIGKGIVPAIDVLGALTIMLSACLWSFLCTWKGLEISNTYSVMGGVIGYGLAVYGRVEVVVLERILISWVASPLCSMGMAIVIYNLLTRLFRNYLNEHRFLKAISYLLIISLCFSAYAFGANDVGNATGVYVTVAQKVGRLPDYTTMIILAAFGSLGIAIGGLTWGHRVIETVAFKIIRLDLVSGFAAELANAFVVYLFVTLPYLLFGYGLPISTSIASVGSVIGVGLAKDRKAVNRGTIFRLVTTWVLTVPSTAVMSVTFFTLLSRLVKIA